MAQTMPKISFFVKARDVLHFLQGYLFLGGGHQPPTGCLLRHIHGYICSIQGHILRKALHEHQLVGVWRLQNLSEQDYTFFSPPTDAYSRIDMFLVPHPTSSDW